MRTATLLLLSLVAVIALSSGVRAQDSSESNPARSLQLHRLESKIFGNARYIRVLLPAGYDLPRNASRRYPVLYLNDGQNLFDKTTSLFNPMEWGVDEAVTKLLADGVPPMIIVGIDNAGTSARANEYLPYPDEYLSPPLPNPQGVLYPDFLVGEVIPLVARTYRIRNDRASTTLGGSSYGALIALYAYLKYPEVFGKLLLESPSLYVSKAKILDQLKSLKVLPERVYIGVGTNEEGRSDCTAATDGGDPVADVLQLGKLLKIAGLKSKSLSVAIDSCAVHNEEAWARRFPSAIKFLFK